MMSDPFASSDSVRHARPLRHAQSASFDAPLELERGGRLPGLTVAFETYGRLSRRGDNAILVCHALSGDSHVAQHDEQDVFENCNLAADVAVFALSRPD